MVNPEAGQLTRAQSRELGRREQFQADCEAICWYCANKNYEAALYDDEAEAFTHTKIDTKKKSKKNSETSGKKEHCDATLLYEQWAIDHKDK